MVFDKLSKSISVNQRIARKLNQYFLHLTQALCTERLITRSEVVFFIVVCLCLSTCQQDYYENLWAYFNELLEEGKKSGIQISKMKVI